MELCTLVECRIARIALILGTLAIRMNLKSIEIQQKLAYHKFLACRIVGGSMIM